jgi:putative membrane-bound dehydrogenase-like protein
MKKKKLIAISLLSASCFYLVSFKNPLRTSVLEQILDDSTYFKFTNEQKRASNNAISGLILDESLKISLVASEPAITNPTDIDVDARGRVWLCEGYNYRPDQNNANDKLNPLGDRIMILEDADGDGKAEKSKVFYQGNDVNAALGILVLGNKVIVSCSPKVFVFTDEDGDDKADKKEILFQGVGGEQHDHAIHAFVYGPDGKLYFNYGNEGGQLLDKNGNPLKDKFGNPVNGKGKPYRQGMVFRCNVDGTDLEVLGHNFRNNYEVAADAFGTLWQSDNDDDGNKSVRINYVMEYGNYGYQDEITGAGWQARRTNMEVEIPRRHWHQNDPGCIPNMLVTGAGSPTGIMVYEGDLLPQKFQNQVIHCDAGPKVVRAYPTIKSGAGYAASIVNLIYGRDDWFRPSDVCTAPDGSLIVADWYDPGVGGHQRGDIVKGRIYRLTISAKMDYKISPADFSSPDGAALALSSPNMATRYLAWEKLKSYGDKAEKPLVKLLKSENPRVRARMLWFLSKMEGKSKKYLETGFADKDADVRIASIRMARQTNVDFVSNLKKLAKDGEPQVRREVAIALRALPSSAETAQIWADLATQYDGKDRWYLEALGIGADTHGDDFFKVWKEKVGTNWNTEAGRNLVWRARNPLALPLLGILIADETTPKADIAKYFRAFDFHPQSDIKRDVLLGLLDVKGANKDEIFKQCLPQFSAADVQYSSKLKQMIYSRLNEIKGSYEYLDMVGKFKLADQSVGIYNMIISTNEKPLADEAMKALVGANGLEMIKDAMKNKSVEERIKLMDAMIYTENQEIFEFKTSLLLDASQPLALKKAVINSFSWGWDGQDYFLDFIKKGKLPKELEPAAGNLLLNANRSGFISEAAKYIKMPAMDSDKPMPTISELTKKKGVVENGMVMYQKYCLNCHVVNNKGVNFGPALSEIGDKFGKDGLYMAILMPDAGVSFGYEGFLVKSKNGERGMGIITSETEADLDLKMMGGTMKSFKKSEILEKKKMEKSMMPSLYANMSEQELVDLVEYLTTLKKSN